MRKFSINSKEYSNLNGMENFVLIVAQIAGFSWGSDCWSLVFSYLGRKHSITSRDDIVIVSYLTHSTTA